MGDLPHPASEERARILRRHSVVTEPGSTPVLFLGLLAGLAQGNGALCRRGPPRSRARNALPDTRRMHSNRFFSLLLLLSLGAGGCSTPPLPEEHAKASTLSPDLRWDELTLGPNDIVRVGVFGHPELSTPLSGTRGPVVRLARLCP